MIKEEMLNEAKAYGKAMSLCYPMERDDYEKAFLEGAKKMEGYARQQAIAFDIWKRQNGYLIDPDGEVYLKLIVEGDKARNEPVSVDAVYNQFIKECDKE